MKLTPTEIKHLIRLVYEDTNGAYCFIGQQQYEKQAARIIKKLEAELRYLREIEREAKI